MPAAARNATRSHGTARPPAAPGEALITLFPGGNYAAVWGTSFSSALVAGGASFVVFPECFVSLYASGTGLLPEPTKEVTPGVLRTTYQDSSDMTMLTRM